MAWIEPHWQSFTPLALRCARSACCSARRQARRAASAPGSSPSVRLPVPVDRRRQHHGGRHRQDPARAVARGIPASARPHSGHRHAAATGARSSAPQRVLPDSDPVRLRRRSGAARAPQRLRGVGRCGPRRRRPVASRGAARLRRPDERRRTAALCPRARCRALRGGCRARLRQRLAAARGTPARAAVPTRDGRRRRGQCQRRERPSSVARPAAGADAALHDEAGRPRVPQPPQSRASRRTPSISAASACTRSPESAIRNVSSRHASGAGARFTAHPFPIITRLPPPTSRSRGRKRS